MTHLGGRWDNTTSLDACGVKQASGGTQNSHGLVGEGWSDQDDNPAKGIYSCYDSCSRTKCSYLYERILLTCTMRTRMLSSPMTMRNPTLPKGNSSSRLDFLASRYGKPVATKRFSSAPSRIHFTSRLGRFPRNLRTFLFYLHICQLSPEGRRCSSLPIWMQFSSYL